MNTYDLQYMALKQTKLESIINKQATVVSVARDLEVSRQTIHKWLSRYKRFGLDGLITVKSSGSRGGSNRTSPQVEQLVINLSRQYHQDGVLTLHDRLEYEYNITLHPVTIYRILKRRNIRYTSVYSHTKMRWKKQLYAHATAGLELQMDTKYPFGYKQGKVIYTIIDDATRWVFAWSYSSANAVNTLDFLNKVITRAPFDVLKIRTDQGTEFTALAVKQFLSDNDITHRRNTPYCPEENGKIERFHRTLNQKALKYGFTVHDSLDLLQYRLNLFLHYYNYQKKHRGLGMDGLTPMAKLEERASVNLKLQCYNY